MQCGRVGSRTALCWPKLDADYERVYQRCGCAARAFIEFWFSDTDYPIAVDKSRYWLYLLETVKTLYPDFKMIICLRDLLEVHKSIEFQHRETLLLTFPGRIEQNLGACRSPPRIVSHIPPLVCAHLPTHFRQWVAKFLRQAPRPGACAYRMEQANLARSRG